MKVSLSLCLMLLATQVSFAQATPVTAGDTCAHRSAYDVNYDAYSRGLLVCFDKKWETHPLHIVKTLHASDNEYNAIVKTSDNVCVKDHAVQNGMMYASINGKPLGVKTWQHSFKKVPCPTLAPVRKKR